MKISILITSIGSYSCNAIVKSLQNDDDYIIFGCDIYPAKWHAGSLNFKKVFQVPHSLKKEEYISSILRICERYDINYIIPTTDPEIDIYNVNRTEFAEKNITLCISGEKCINIARNKYELSTFFQNTNFFKTIPTFRYNMDLKKNIDFPYVAKQYNGRSSHGVYLINDKELLKYTLSKKNYIVQPFLEGDVYTVDYVRNSILDTEFSLSRQELIRTSNGAGLSVRLVNDEILTKAASIIGKNIDVNGSVNFEFIRAKDEYYLMDINPRFSAGIAFTIIAGYDIVKSHMNCFTGKDIEKSVIYSDLIIARSFIETIMNMKKINKSLL